MKMTSPAQPILCHAEESSYKMFVTYSHFNTSNTLLGGNMFLSMFVHLEPVTSVHFLRSVKRPFECVLAQLRVNTSNVFRVCVNRLKL